MGIGKGRISPLGVIDWATKGWKALQWSSKKTELPSVPIATPIGWDKQSCSIIALIAKQQSMTVLAKLLINPSDPSNSTAFDIVPSHLQMKRFSLALFHKWSNDEFNKSFFFNDISNTWFSVTTEAALSPRKMWRKFLRDFSWMDCWWLHVPKSPPALWTAARAWP